MPRPNILTKEGSLASDLWIDRPDAPDLIHHKLERGEISAVEAERLNSLCSNGYAVFPSGLPSNVLDEAITFAHKLWTDRPEDLLAASNSLNRGRPMSLAHFPDNFEPSPACRMLDAHSHNPIFAQLISLPVLHRFIELVLEEPCVATQSLYFPFGSAQGLHRDPWFVVTTPVSTLFAAWIALEDICVESGPLSFVPGSHRLSYKPLNTGDIIFHEKEATDESRAAHVMDMHAQISSLGLEQKLFLAKQGEILVWHGSLVHGGSKIAPVPPTRESFVVHFDAAKNRKRVAQGLNYDGQSLGVIDTNKINNIDGKLYFENPALGKALLSLKPKG